MSKEVKKLSHAARSKIAKRSKARGSAFELKVAKMFTAFVKETKYPANFYRVPASGGLRRSKESNVIGDITCDRLDFLFTVECKKHEHIDLEVLFERRKSNKSVDLISFYTQACKEAIRADKEPLLVVERKRGKPYITVPKRVFDSIKNGNVNEEHIIFATIKLPKEWSKGWEKVVLMPFKEFLNNVIVNKLFIEEEG